MRNMGHVFKIPGPRVYISIGKLSVSGEGGKIFGIN